MTLCNKAINIVITSRGEERAGRCTGRLPVYKRLVVSRFTIFLLGARGGLRSRLRSFCFILSFQSDLNAQV